MDVNICVMNVCQKKMNFMIRCFIQSVLRYYHNIIFLMIKCEKEKKMRIGEFAQKHGITQDTVRYYLDMGLLVTEKNGGQYKFSEADSKDIDKIIELKQLEFSLTEIQKILTFQRVSGTNTDTFRNLYLSFLEEKKNEATKELSRYNKMNAFLNDRIHKLKTVELSNMQKLGFPISSLGILVCPMCQDTLDVSNGRIEKNMIIHANIQCECGYKASIKNGIFIDEEAVRTKTINGKKMPTKEEFLASASHQHINFLYKGMASIIEYIKKYGKEPKYIMELDNCVGFFLLQYIKYLPYNATYILVDYDIDRMTQLKNNLEMYYEHKNFIFLCCDYHKLPILKSSMDILVDYCMTKTYAESTGEYLLDEVLPLLKQEGLFVGTYPYFDANAIGNTKLPANIREYHSKSRMLEKLHDSYLTSLDITDIGPIIQGNPYDTDMKDINLSQTVYAGRKRIIQYVKPKVHHINTDKKAETWG